MRTALAAVLAASLLLSGCLGRQTGLPVLPPGEDPDGLVEEIARRGQGPVRGEPARESEGPGLTEEAVLLTATIGMRVALTAVVVALAVAYGMAPGPHSPPANGDNTVGAALGKLWAPD